MATDRQTVTERKMCRADGCTFRGTHGPLAIDDSRPFCHTHWWMLPGELRGNFLANQVGVTTAAVEWLSKESQA